MMKYFPVIVVLFAGIIISVTGSSQSTVWTKDVYSPDKKLKIALKQDTGNIVYYQFRADGETLLDWSQLGPVTTGKLLLLNKTTKTVNSVWKPLWGKRSIVRNHYNELVLKFNLFVLRIRLFNDGVAFRYENSSAENERTQFNFAGNYTAWYYNFENRNIGPEKIKDADGERPPVMTVKIDEHHYMAIHEADLRDGEPLKLKPNKGTTIFTVPSKRANAWRVIMYGRTPGDLVDSHLIELLNPESSGDFSWVKPGLAVWDWRINGAVADGFKYDMSLPSWKRMVDFASANGISGLVLDADWYGPEFNKTSDPVKGGKVDQVHQIIAYGKQKNVGIWLYLNDVGGKTFSLEEILKQYHDWGAVGIKYGFMQGNYEEKNKHTQLITQLCAQNHLMVDFHDNPVHPYGQMRTWPNAVTREYCQSQLDAHRVFQPGTFVTAVFVNMLAGPIDMCNGVVDMEQKGRVDNPTPVPATIVGEAARTLITFSGLTVISDIPENYYKYPEILKFIRSEKMPWKESKTLSGEIGEYIVMARKTSDDNWLIGAATDESEREVSINLSFLDNSPYEALILQDGADASYKVNKEHYTTTFKTVKKSDSLYIRLAPGGGSCILLKKKPGIDL